MAQIAFLYASLHLQYVRTYIQDGAYTEIAVKIETYNCRGQAEVPFKVSFQVLI